MRIMRLSYGEVGHIFGFCFWQSRLKFVVCLEGYQISEMSYINVHTYTQIKYICIGLQIQQK